MSVGRLKIGAALVICAPFVPMIFQGEEFAASTPFLYFTNHGDQELGRAVSEGRRSEFAAFGWKRDDVPDPQDPATFRRSKLDWTEPQREPHAEMLDWYRRLFELRRSIPALTDGRMDRVKVRFDEQEGWLAVQRGAIHVFCNVAHQERTIPIGDFGVLMCSSPDYKLSEDAIQLAPDSVAIVQEEFAESRTGSL